MESPDRNRAGFIFSRDDPGFFALVLCLAVLAAAGFTDALIFHHGWFRKSPIPPFVGLGLLFAGILWAVANLIQAAGNEIAIGPEGIASIPRHGGKSPVFIAWTDIVTVHALDFARTLIVYDGAGRRIAIWYHRQDFSELLETVLARTASGRDRFPPAARFHRRAARRGKIMGLCLAAAIVAVRAGAHAQWSNTLDLAGLAGAAGILMLREPYRLELTSQAIRIDYPVWRSIVPLATIEDIRIAYLPGYSAITVEIRRANGTMMALSGWREGPIAMGDALREAWLDREYRRE